MAAKNHLLPENRPKAEHEMPQGVKNWDQPPQQVDGPSGPEPHPTPEEAGAGESNWKKPVQQDKPKPAELVEQPDPTGEMNWDDPPQRVDGGEGPAPTDGYELTEAVNSQELVVEDGRVVGMTGTKPRSKTPADPKSSGSKEEAKKAISKPDDKSSASKATSKS